ncbi:unnamed protein product [Rotaria sp. Silwood2]|nr:unnamed protein product [Rotaria sp. Silwood2]
MAVSIANKFLKSTTVVWLGSNINRTSDYDDAQQQLKNDVGEQKIFSDINECTDYLMSTKLSSQIFLIVTDILPKYVNKIIDDFPHVLQVCVIFTDPDDQQKWLETWGDDREWVTKENFLVFHRKPLINDGMAWQLIEICASWIRILTSLIPLQVSTSECLKKLDEDVIIVWLGLSNMNRQMNGHYHSIINYVKTFDNADACIDYLLSIPTGKKVLFILSNVTAEYLIPLIYELKQISSFYILLEKDSERWSSINCSKIQGVFFEEKRLFSRLTIDIASYSKHTTMPTSLYRFNSKEKSIRDLSKENAVFMWHQMLLEILIALPQVNESKDQLIDECCLCYENDQIEQKKIDEFRKMYTPEQAIRWYTRNSFLYRSINKALRTEDFDIIFKFRYIITDIHNQLKQHSFSENEIKTVYRGQFVPSEQFKRLNDNIGGLISMNTFLSTSTDRNVALTFAGDGSARPILESVLFEINIDKKVQTKPFANIEELSYYQDEGEILFSIGTVFQIKAVEKFTDDIWLIKLNQSVEQDDQLNKLMKHYQKEIMFSSYPALNFAGFLFMMGELDKAERYCKILLSETNSKKSSIYNLLGLISNDKGEHDQAQTYYALSLEDRAYTSDESLFLLHPASTYNNAGLAYFYQENNDMALEQFLKAIDALSTRYCLPLLAITYNHLGMVCRRMEEYAAAFKYYSLALQVKKIFYPSCHPEMASTYCNIGVVHFMLGYYENALRCYNRALEIELRCLPPTHPDLATTYHNIADVYMRTGRMLEAIEYFEKSLAIDLLYLPLDHPNIINTRYSLHLFKAIHNT